MKSSNTSTSASSNASAEPRIRGSVVRDARDWARTAYGLEAYRSALAKLSPDEQAIIDGQILAGSWYPLATWDRFLHAMRGEARTRMGHSEREFDRRNMQQAGSAIVRGAYKIVLSVMSPESIINKVVLVYNRGYSDGQCVVVENSAGRAVIRYEGDPAFHTNVSHHLPAGVEHVLGMAGAKDVSSRISRDEVVGGRLMLEVTYTYRR